MIVVNHHDRGRNMSRVLRCPQVVYRVGWSRVTIWRAERDGNFPRRIRLGPNSVGWLEDEIEEWLRSRPRGMTAGEGDAVPHTGVEVA